ncbi:MAG: helix-turn-helix domain-containing protein [Chloroflexota bacterium]
MTEKKPRPKRWDRQSVRALRKHLGVSQDALAEELGTRQQTVSEWETGQYQPRGASAKLLGIIAERAGFAYEAVSNVTGEAGKPQLSGGSTGPAQPAVGKVSAESPVRIEPVGEDRSADAPTGAPSIGEDDAFESPTENSPSGEDSFAASPAHASTTGEATSFESSAGSTPTDEAANKRSADGQP